MESLIPNDIVYLNALGTVKNRLPNLLMGEENIETSSNHSLRGVFIGQMNRWTAFNREVTGFYSKQALQDAFERCSNAGVSHDFTSMGQKWDTFMTLEQASVGAEIDLNGRFLNNVVNVAISVTKTLMDPQRTSAAQMEDLKKILPTSLNAGSSKIVPKHMRKPGEPDLVFMMRVDKGYSEERLIGELKLPVTCHLGDTVDMANTEPGRQGDQSSKSLRHMFGK